jgi:hypothetical protein
VILPLGDYILLLFSIGHQARDIHSFGHLAERALNFISDGHFGHKTESPLPLLQYSIIFAPKREFASDFLHTFGMKTEGPLAPLFTFFAARRRFMYS